MASSGSGSATASQATRFPQPDSILSAKLTAIDMVHDPESGLLSATLQPRLRPGHGPALLADLADMTERLQRLFAAEPGAQPFRHLVSRSAVPGIFNLGADPGALAESVRARQTQPLSDEIRNSAARHYDVANGFSCPIVTIALVEGDALGTGFEYALAHDILIAERSVQFGFPGTMAGLFPAAGAANFLIRRAGRVAAERLMLDGALRSGEELHALGIVDVLAEDGDGENQLRSFVAQHEKRFTMQRAVYAARRRVHPISREAIDPVCDLWVETAMRLSPTGLDVLDRLAMAERGRLAAARPRT